MTILSMLSVYAKIIRMHHLSSAIYLRSTKTQNKTLIEHTGIKCMVINATKINIVLVHGIWFDASSWSKVISILQNVGHRVIAVHLSLSLTDDVSERQLNSILNLSRKNIDS